MNRDLTQFGDPQFEALRLRAEDSPAVQLLLEACADYCRIVLNREPLPGDAQALYCMGPEAGKDAGDKLLFGIRVPGSSDIVGLLDAFRDYPEPGVWYIGLLLFLPDARSGGVGRAVVEALAVVALQNGAHEFQLNVVDQNERAKRFWNACGFTEMRRWQQHFGNRESTFIRMRRALNPH